MMRPLMALVMLLGCVVAVGSAPDLSSAQSTESGDVETASESEQPVTTVITPLVGRYEVRLRDGRRLEVDWVLRGESGIEVGVGSARARFGDFQLLDVRKLPEPEVEFRERRSRIADTNIEARYELAFDFYQRGFRDLALTELDDLREHYPDSLRVTTLHELIRDQIAAEERLRREEAADTALERSTPEIIESRVLRLSPEQISLLRLWEMPDDLRSVRPKVRVPAEVLREVFERYADHPAVPRARALRGALMRSHGFDQLQLLFDLEAREYYDRVEVLTDPPVIAMFMGVLRRGYHGRYFARYFGDGKIEGLPISGSGIDPAGAYADFATLAVTSIDGLPMLNRADPARSLYVQWGLPRDVAEFPAPRVPGWRPYFRGTDDRVYLFLVEWVDSFYEPGGPPDYGFPWPPDDGDESGAAGDSLAPVPVEADRGSGLLSSPVGLGYPHAFSVPKSP
ncbi:MAG: hypothetical protein RIG82_13330 [Phycisphaeraceae bacterium]